jgi:predicted alpha/beta-hydrolase family hydrolase
MSTDDAVPARLCTGPAAPLLVLAHGAGAPMDSEFMSTMAALLATAGIGVVRFEFPYMQERRRTGSRRPPNPQPVLLECWRQQVAALGDPARLVIGGKSMGGRMASLVADELGVAGLVCLGYPFHPPGQPEKLRTAHLATLQTPTLIVQGTRDALGNADEVAEYPLAAAIQTCWLEDGDHDLKPRQRSGHTHAGHLHMTAQAVAEFIRRCTGRADS